MGVLIEYLLLSRREVYKNSFVDFSLAPKESFVAIVGVIPVHELEVALHQSAQLRYSLPSQPIVGFVVHLVPSGVGVQVDLLDHRGLDF